MPKRFEGLCRKYGRYSGNFEVVDDIKYFVLFDGYDRVQIPVKLIDKLREDEWAYDSSQHNILKEKVK